MKKNSSLGWVIALVSAIVAVSAALTTLYLFKKKKDKDNAELEEYLDNAIITNPKSGELYRLNSTLLSVDNGSIKECIEQAITQWLTEHGYIE